MSDIRNYDMMISNGLKKLCKIHFLTKKYIIKSEELAPDFKVYLQPMKEQKDAYEHIMRACSKVFRENPDDSVIDVKLNEDKSNTNTISESNLEYIVTNIDKAIGHEYRAFFDTLDYLSIIIRKRISDELKDFSYKEIVKVYPEYEIIKKSLLSLPEEISIQRERKDIGNFDSMGIINNYCLIIDNLIKNYTKIVDNIFSKIS